MFHRMKSETQEETPAQEEAQASEDVKAQEEQAEQTAQQDTGTSAKPAESEAIEDVDVEAAQQDLLASEDAKSEESKTEDHQQDQNEDEAMSDQTTDNNEDTQAEDRSLDIPQAAYQRSGTAPAAAATQTAPSYTTSSYNTQVAQPVETAEEEQAEPAEDRVLTIGAGITMSGEIEACDRITVEGTVEAALKGARILDVAESGVFYGTVSIDDATIAGRFEGDLTVNGCLRILSTGAITGSIVYGQLEVEAGAVIDGKLTPASAVAAKAQKPAKKKAKATAKKVEAAAPSEVSNDDGLFSPKAAVAAE